MAEVHSWNNHPDTQGLVRQAVEALTAGRLVVLPTELGSVVAADARVPHAVSALTAATGTRPLCVVVAGPTQAVAVQPNLPPLARRLGRRCWPGPITLLTGLASPNLPEVLQTARDADGRMWLRCPAHAAVLEVLDAVNGPLLTAGGAADLGDAVALVIDDGPGLYPDGDTRVLFEGDSWKVVREGVVTAEQVRVQLACVIVFVCTGNTCRSPLAEVLCQKRLAERLGCAVEELPARGFLVLSAGVSAYPGDTAADNAVAVARAYGMDLSRHASRTVNPELVYQADYLVGMTRGHLQVLAARYPQQGGEIRLLNPEGRDLLDPVGQDESVYRDCAAQVWKDVDSLVSELLPEGERR